MIRAGILGGSGYTGSRLAYYLARHTDADIAFVTSRREAGKPMSDLYGSLGGLCDLPFVDPNEVTDVELDVLFTCAPDQTSMKIVPSYLERGVRVIDLAGDFRMDTGEAYSTWYGAPHDSPDYIAEAVYGLTELNRASIRDARLVANPGCYPTSVILGLAPLLGADMVAPDSVVISSSSGISGAGRPLTKMFKHFYETDSNVMPYGQGRAHKHVGEIEQELSKLAGTPCTVLFAPQVVPMKTGILSTIFVKLTHAVDRDEVVALYEDAYAGEFFVRFHPSGLPQSKYVADTNFCDIGVTLVGDDRAVVTSTICNLGKGASGQAVQNMNVMFGFDEREGLL